MAKNQTGDRWNGFSGAFKKWIERLTRSRGGQRHDKRLFRLAS
jgi:hypothetical protein